MITASRFDHPSGSRAKLDATPVVQVVDEDISVRESLELLIRSAGCARRPSLAQWSSSMLRRTLGPACPILMRFCCPT
jgi:FixJ family two-component response regulator